MSDISIRVEHISKRYRLGEREPYKSLREVVSRAAATPLGWMHRNGRPAADNGLGYFWALDDISFEIKLGEAVGIIGRNGAGKSTLLKILSRITKPTRGQAQIYGRVGSLLEVGTGFHPELTGRENIYLNGTILGMKRKEIERKFDEIVAFAEVEKFLDTPVKRYSSGMYVRLAFAVAAHLEPEILLVDEVLAVGDAGFQKKCLGKMGDIASEGRTVLFVSHNMAAILSLCERCFVVDKGQIITDTKAKMAVDRYLSMISEEQSNSASIFHLASREGNQRLRFCEINFLDPDTKENLSLLRAGQSIIIRVKYQVLDPTAFGQDLKLGCGFLDMFDQFKVGMNSEAVGANLSVSADGIVDFVIPKFPLSQGRYFVYLYAEINQIASDWVRNAISVDVVKGDFYGTGKLPVESASLVYIPYKVKSQ